MTVRAASAFFSAVAPLALGLSLAGCASGSSTGDDPEPDVAPDSYDLDFEAFLQDRPSVAHRWYDYDNNTHVLTPKPEAYVVRRGDGAAAEHAAMRITTYYNENTGDSGYFDLETAVYDGGWSNATTLDLEGNVKEAPVCVDLFNGEALSCDSADWQVQLRADRVLVPGASFVVANPAVHFRSRAGVDESVRSAVVEDIDQLSELSDPGALEALDDGAADAWDDVTWDRTRLSANLPERGMLLGPRAFGDGFTSTGDVYFFISARARLFKVALSPATDGAVDDGVSVHFTSAAVDAEAGTASAFEEADVGEVPAPAEGERVYVQLDHEDGLTVLPSPTNMWVPPETQDWLLAFDRIGDSLRVVMSPSTVAVNATERGEADDFASAAPPAP